MVMASPIAVIQAILAASIFWYRCCSRLGDVHRDFGARMVWSFGFLS